MLGSSTTFNEDDQKFRSFFQKRYDSIEDLRTKLEGVFIVTMKWLLDEVFRQDNHEGKTEAEIQQDEFEEEYAQDIEDAIAQM